MAMDRPKHQTPVIQWLLDSDPSIRWQVMRDLICSPPEEVATERTRVATEGASAKLLSLQAADGRWRDIVARLLAEQLPDGGWNCEAVNGSTRSSFNTTICVLEALLAYERAVGVRQEVVEARLRGQEYLLERRLLRRRSTGEVIERDRKGGSAWTRFAFPTWWHYDVLRGLDYLSSAGVAYDERMAEAIELVASKRHGDGWWRLETSYPGVMLVEIDQGEGRPSRWNTLRAMRVLSAFRRD